MNIERLVLLLMVLLGSVATGCGQPQDPLQKIQTEMRQEEIQDYSIMLADMQVSGNFIKSYTHTYRIITPQKASPYGPVPVPKKMYDYYKPYLGMTIWSQKDGQGGENLAPPGYAYVGDPRYGEWRRDSSGRSFWEFYGRYRLLSDLLGLGGRVFRGEYDSYRGYYGRRQPYYGPNHNYGTGGSVTRRQYPDFYRRQQERARASRSTFANKVNRRIGRTRTSTRGRGILGGK